MPRDIFAQCRSSKEGWCAVSTLQKRGRLIRASRYPKRLTRKYMSHVTISGKVSNYSSPLRYLKIGANRAKFLRIRHVLYGTCVRSVWHFFKKFLSLVSAYFFLSTFQPEVQFVEVDWFQNVFRVYKKLWINHSLSVFWSRLRRKPMSNPMKMTKKFALQ